MPAHKRHATSAHHHHKKHHHKLHGAGINWDPLGVGQKARDWAWHVQQDTKDLPTFVNSVKREQSDPNSWSHQAVNAVKGLAPEIAPAAASVGYGRKRSMRGGDIKSWWNKFTEDVKKPEKWHHEISHPDSYTNQAINLGKKVMGGRKPHLVKGSEAARRHMAALRSMRR